MKIIRSVLCLPALLIAAAGGYAAGGPMPAGVDVRLPSPSPSGFPRNDTIPVSYYAPSGPGRAPAVIILHPLGEKTLRLWRQFARYLARNGIGAAVIVLPYHMERSLRREPPGHRFIDNDPRVAVQAYQQSLADIRAVTDWLERQPTVDPHCLGVIGISLGAILAHTAMGKDARLNAGVALLGGGDLLRIRRQSILFVFQRRHSAGPLPAHYAEMLSTVDPMAFAGANRPRRVLMVEAARDNLVPPSAARELWEALGRPHIQWMDTNHFALSLDARAAFRTSTRYLQSVWGIGPADVRIPAIHPPTITLGWVAGLAGRPTMALQYKVAGAGSVRHMSLLHLDAGLDALGPFLGAAATLTPYIDVGVARRAGRPATHGYVSLHITM